MGCGESKQSAGVQNPKVDISTLVSYNKTTPRGANAPIQKQAPAAAKKPKPAPVADKKAEKTATPKKEEAKTLTSDTLPPQKQKNVSPAQGYESIQQSTSRAPGPSDE